MNRSSAFLFSLIRLGSVAMLLGVAVCPLAAQDADRPAATPASEPAEGAAEEQAQGQGQADDESRREFLDAIEAMEAKIAEQEHYGRYGHPVIQEYVRELEQEYLDNQGAIATTAGQVDADQSDRNAAILARQQHLSMLLWQVQRVALQFGSSGNKSLSMTNEMRQLLSKHRDALKDPKMMKRYQDVMRRSLDVSRSRFSNRQAYQFFFARPKRALSAATDGPETPQQDTDSRFQNGPIQTLREPIGHLVRLSWKDGFLVWDERHWETPFAGQTLEAIAGQVHSELQSRGVEFGESDRIATMRNKNLFAAPRPVLLFQDLQYVASQGKPPSQSLSSSGATSRSRFQVDEIEADLLVSPEKTEFSVHEENGPSRQLSILKTNQRQLRVRLIGDHILVLDQAEDGSVRLVDVGDEAQVIKAASFAELYAQHPSVIEQSLFPRLEHCGIQIPMKRYDDELVARVMDHLRGVDEATKDRFDKLVGQIDSGSFGERQKAYRELSEDVARFSLLLVATSDEDGRSAEATARLAELRKKYGEQFRELDSLLTKTAWLTDPSYLLGLAHKLDDQDRAMVIAKLQEVSGQTLGTDLQQWQRWLETVSGR